MERSSRPQFHEELDTLQERLMEMAGLVEQSLARATDAALGGEPVDVGDLFEADRRVDELEVEIDERVIELLALQQPMATDLRLIVTANKISNDLERIGDHAVNIGKAVSRLSETSPIPDLRELDEMVPVTRKMVHDALTSYVSRNPDSARVVCLTDDRVDDLKRTLFRVLVTHMLEDPKRIGAALEFMLISQNLERVADLATNISEDVVFLVEGRSIKHRSDSEGGDS